VNILLLHPEGNLNYNANLLGLMDILGEHGHRVTYVAPRRQAINQRSAAAGLNVVLLDRHHVHGRLLFPGIRRADDIDAAPWAGHDLVLGVDRGVIDASWIARHLGIPHALLSYEIFFAAEAPADRKAEDVDACRDLSFAVCQDALRTRMLCLANRIPPEKVLQIPVAGRGFRLQFPKPRALHRMFGLAAGTKTALYAGSLADWTGAAFLLESTRNWPEDWMLVIHERTGPTRQTAALIQAHGNPARIRTSEAGFDHPGEMTEFIQSADIGVALYCPTYANEWVGRNIRDIGLASGKISGYLQHGIPVATHEIGELSDWIRFYGAGQVFALDQPFIPQEPAAGSVDACRSLFERHLDLDRFAAPLLRAVAGTTPGSNEGS
jgi:O-antigen biosynthesis protein